MEGYCIIDGGGEGTAYRAGGTNCTNQRRLHTTDWLTRSILRQTVAVIRASPYSHRDTGTWHARTHARTATDVGVCEKDAAIRATRDADSLRTRETRDARARARASVLHLRSYTYVYVTHAIATKQKIYIVL